MLTLYFTGLWRMKGKRRESVKNMFATKRVCKQSVNKVCEHCNLSLKFNYGCSQYGVGCYDYCPKCYEIYNFDSSVEL